MTGQALLTLFVILCSLCATWAAKEATKSLYDGAGDDKADELTVGKRAYMDTFGERNPFDSGFGKRRPFDPLASGLIGKRGYHSRPFSYFDKRPFDPLASGLIGKRAPFDPLASGLIGKRRPFDPLASGLIGKRAGYDNDVYGERGPFDPLASGLIGKRD